MPIKRKNATIPLSVFIICKNEEDRISTAIKSVHGWADEIIVVDGGSTDNTLKVARKSGATKVVFNKWDGYGKQKSYAESLCKHRWVFNVDADEEITPSLRNEITQIIKSPGEVSAYNVTIKILARFTDKTPLLGPQDVVIRLYDKKQATYSTHPIHDSVIVNTGKISKLKNYIKHRTFRSYSHAIEKINFYTSMQAQDMLKKNRKPKLIRLVTEPITMFMKAYFLNKYIFLGLEGFIESVIYAFSKTLRLAKGREIFHRNKKK